MNYTEQDIFTLENFEGSIEFLMHLIQKEELDIYEIPLRELTRQFLSKLELCTAGKMDFGPEFIASAASLVCLKSKTLLPKHEQEAVPEEEEDPHFEIIHHLVDYCRFKQAARDLVEREQKQSAYFFRGGGTPQAKIPLGLEHLTLEDLASLFQGIVAKAGKGKGEVKEEEWQVGDKIRYIRALLKTVKSVDFLELFRSGMSRGELVVTFLAILELMKLGEGKVVKETSTGKVFVITG